MDEKDKRIKELEAKLAQAEDDRKYMIGRAREALINEFCTEGGIYNPSKRIEAIRYLGLKYMGLGPWDDDKED
jgi:hypothetical protein